MKSYEELVQLKNPDGKLKYEGLSEECPSALSHRRGTIYIACINCGKLLTQPAGRIPKPATLELLLDALAQGGTEGISFMPPNTDMNLDATWKVGIEKGHRPILLSSGATYTEAAQNELIAAEEAQRER